MLMDMLPSVKDEKLQMASMTVATAHNRSHLSGLPILPLSKVLYVGAIRDWQKESKKTLGQAAADKEDEQDERDYDGKHTYRRHGYPSTAN